MARDAGRAGRPFTAEEKLELVTEIARRYCAGEGSLQAIARKLGTSDTNYHNWVRAGIRPAPASLHAGRSRAPGS